MMDKKPFPFLKLIRIRILSYLVYFCFGSGLNKWRQLDKRIKGLSKILYFLAGRFGIYICMWDGEIIFNQHKCDFCNNATRDTRQWYEWCKKYIVLPYEGCLFPSIEDELESARRLGYKFTLSDFYELTYIE